jgi:hypothetical protein
LNECVRYLLVAAVLHIGAALYRAYTTKVLKGVTTNPLSVFKRLYLLLSGLAVLAFVLVHLNHFRFREDLHTRFALTAAAGSSSSSSSDSSSSIDFYAVAGEVFSDRLNVVGYLVGVVLMGVHLHYGWGKAVHKMQLDAEHGTAQFLQPVRVLGSVLALAVTAGFAACVLRGAAVQ